MRCHDPDNAAASGVQAGSNDSQDNVLAGEDTSNLRWATGGPGSGVRTTLDNADGSGAVFLHQLGGIANTGTRANSRRLRSVIHNARQVGQGGLLSQGFDVGQHRRRLRIGTSTQFILDTLEGTIEVLRSRGATLYLVECFVEHLGDVEQADDIALLIADRLQ